MSNLSAKISAFFKSASKEAALAAPSSPVRSPNLDEYVVVPSPSNKKRRNSRLAASPVASPLLTADVCIQAESIDANNKATLKRREEAKELAQQIMTDAVTKAISAASRDPKSVIAANIVPQGILESKSDITSTPQQPKLYNVDPSLESEVRTALFEQQHGFHLSDREKVEVFRASHGLPITPSLVDEAIRMQRGFPIVPPPSPPSPSHHIVYGLLKAPVSAAHLVSESTPNLPKLKNVDADMKEEVHIAHFKHDHGIPLNEREKLEIALDAHAQHISSQLISEEIARSHGFPVPSPSSPSTLPPIVYAGAPAPSASKFHSPPSDAALKQAIVDVDSDSDSDSDSDDSEDEEELVAHNAVRLRFSPRPTAKAEKLIAAQENHIHNACRIRYSPQLAVVSFAGLTVAKKAPAIVRSREDKPLNTRWIVSSTQKCDTSF